MFARDTEPALVADGVVRLGTELINWYLLEDGGRVVVVDGGVPAYRRQLERGLAVLGKATSDIEAIVLTHGHADHTGVVEPLREELSLPVHVHADDKELATTGKAFGKTEASLVPYLRYPHAWKLLGHFVGAGRSKPVRSVQTFADGAELPGGLHAIHTGGHSAARIVHAGGDATGKELQRALLAKVRSIPAPTIRLFEKLYFLTDRKTGSLAWLTLTTKLIEI